MSPTILIWVALVITWVILLLALVKVFQFYKQFMELKRVVELDLTGMITQMKKMQAELTEFSLEQQRTNRLTIEMLEVQRQGMIAEIIEEIIE